MVAFENQSRPLLHQNETICAIPAFHEVQNEKQTLKTLSTFALLHTNFWPKSTSYIFQLGFAIMDYIYQEFTFGYHFFKIEDYNLGLPIRLRKCPLLP